MSGTPATLASRSLPATNKKVIDLLLTHDPWGGKILDLGSGEGYLSSLIVKELLDRGCVPLDKHLSACDLFPGEYGVEGIKCDFCDFNSSLPYEDHSFNAVCSVEVIEHLENIFHYAREISRVLKTGGVAVVTTPNILNINSRLRFLATGFPLLFDPLPLSSQNPQDVSGHINPNSFYYLTYAFARAGFGEIKVHTDRLKNSARILTLPLYGPIRLFEKIVFHKLRKKERQIYEENLGAIQQINSSRLLLGRTAIIEAVKKG